MLATVRKACLPAIWSQGVKLARENAVSKVSEGKGEITLRVRAGGLPVPPTVTPAPAQPTASPTPERGARRGDVAAVGLRAPRTRT